MSEHWEFIIKRPDGKIETFSGKSKGGGKDPYAVAEHVASMSPFEGCTVTAKYLGDSDSHVSVGFRQKGQKKKLFRMVHKKPTTKLMFNSAGQQVNASHQIITKSDKGEIVVGSPEYMLQHSSTVVDVVDAEQVDLPSATVGPNGEFIESELVVPEPNENEVKAPPEATVVPELVKDEPK